MVENLGVSAADDWARALSSWAIPDEILRRTAESPWGLPARYFADRTRSSLGGNWSPTHYRAAEVLTQGALVLDVGSGAGAASIPLAPPVAQIVAVDQSPEMLAELEALAADRVAVTKIEGVWPAVADLVPEVDVAVCANVAYNVADLDAFLVHLTGKARRRVVLELTTRHPQSDLNWLWQHFWGLDRPESPTWEDARRLAAETLGLQVHAEVWEGRNPPAGPLDDEGVAWVRRRLCLSSDRDAELRKLLQARGGLHRSPEMATLWWEGQAGN